VLATPHRAATATSAGPGPILAYQAGVLLAALLLAAAVAIWPSFTVNVWWAAPVALTAGVLTCAGWIRRTNRGRAPSRAAS
jgi:hypothetical protein